MIGIVSGVGTLHGKARNAGQPRSPADRLNVLIENKTGRILPGNSDLVRINLVRIFDGRAVLYDQTGHNLGPLRPVVACVARHCARSPEILLIDRGHHLHHSARRLFQRRIVGVLCPTVLAFRRMAFRAVQAEGGGKESHRVHEFIHGDAFKNLDILEYIFHHQRFLLLCRLRARGFDRQHAYEHHQEHY